MKLVSGLTMALVLSGCAMLSYEKPQSGPRARVRFATDTDAVAVIWSYDDASCKTNEKELMRLRVGFLANPEVKRLGLPLWSFHQNAAKEVYVEVGKPNYYLFSVGVAQPNMIYRCAVPLQYTFDADKDYEVLYVWDRRNCKVFVSELTGQGEAAARVALKTFDNELTPETSDCIAQFKKTQSF